MKRYGSTKRRDRNLLRLSNLDNIPHQKPSQLKTLLNFDAFTYQDHVTFQKININKIINQQSSLKRRSNPRTTETSKKELETILSYLQELKIIRKLRNIKLIKPRNRGGKALKFDELKKEKMSYDSSSASGRNINIGPKIRREIYNLNRDHLRMYLSEQEQYTDFLSELTDTCDKLYDVKKVKSLTKRINQEKGGKRIKEKKYKKLTLSEREKIDNYYNDKFSEKKKQIDEQIQLKIRREVEYVWRDQEREKNLWVKSLRL